jgi:hypothetical protein
MGRGHNTIRTPTSPPPAPHRPPTGPPPAAPIALRTRYSAGVRPPSTASTVPVMYPAAGVQ